MSKFHWLRWNIICIIIRMGLEVNGNIEVNKKVEEMVEEAGCPFISTQQLLVRNACLMPYYLSNEAPTGFNSKTNVNFDLHEATVLKIDEKTNRITVHMSQDLQWLESRIRANFSQLPPGINFIKLDISNFLQIWHPDLDMYTPNLLDWESLNKKYLFRDIVIMQGIEPDHRTLKGWKDWRATIICNFDFASFPFDTQFCSFLQKSDPYSMMHMFYFPQNTKSLEYEADGFQILITHVGTFVELNHSSVLDGTDGIGFNLTLTRKIKPYLYQYYLPSTAIVVVSQVSFMIPLSAIPGRVALVVTQFLTLTNIFIYQMVRY